MYTSFIYISIELELVLQGFLTEKVFMYCRHGKSPNKKALNQKIWSWQPAAEAEPAQTHGLEFLALDEVVGLS